MSKDDRESILFIAYPLLPVSDESCGGAEQILWSLENEIASRGRHTAVAACDSSRVYGELLKTGACAQRNDAFEEREAQHVERVLALFRERKFSVVHDHSGSFWKHAEKVDAPVLATLHLPRSFYPENLFRSLPHNLYFNCVSKSQAHSFRDLPRMAGVVPNGIDVDRFPLARKKDEYLLWLGRICPEKAPHLAIEAAKKSGLPLIMAGQVYPFTYHQQYFEREVRPLIDGVQVKFIELPTFKEKLEMLRCAKALLVTSLVAETSSLVSLEAQACGTPVVAFKVGALPEVVANGRTGYVVRTLDEMAAAIHDVNNIWPEECRNHVHENFSASAMADGYQSIYELIERENHDLMLMAA